MNKVVLMGRLTADPDVRTIQGTEPLTIARYTLAVDRMRDKTDFISCKCFGRTAEFAEKYLKKGTKILIEGQIQTGKYEKNGATVYTTEVIIDHHEFCERRQDDFPENVPEDMFP